jgi:hypothetical protein
MESHDAQIFSEKRCISRKPPLMWSEIDTHKLLLAYVVFGNDWKKIAEKFPDRTVAQVHYRYQYITSKMVSPSSLYVTLDTVDFTEVYYDLQNS